MQKNTHVGITMFCFVFTLFGLILKFNFGQNNPAITTRYNITKVNDESITVVYPNPESGAINLHCCDDLKSPITIKALNIKFKIVISINDLKADGIN